MWTQRLRQSQRALRCVCESAQGAELHGLASSATDNSSVRDPSNGQAAGRPAELDEQFANAEEFFYKEDFFNSENDLMHADIHLDALEFHWEE